MVPSKGGNPEELLIITTAASPASSPKTARATRAHIPRRVTTTLPAVPAYSALWQPREMDPSAFLSTLTGNEPLGRIAPLASIAVTEAPVLNASVAPGYTGTVASIAATERIPLDVLGEPTRYALLPSLPADVTTEMPSLNAFCAATDVGSLVPPSGEPSDMLMTFTPSATARLMPRST